MIYNANFIDDRDSRHDIYIQADSVKQATEIAEEFAHNNCDDEWYLDNITEFKSLLVYYRQDNNEIGFKFAHTAIYK